MKPVLNTQDRLDIGLLRLGMAKPNKQPADILNRFLQPRVRPGLSRLLARGLRNEF